MRLIIIGLMIIGPFMPRSSRIDAPGALHHKICRGIEHRKIFLGDSDRNELIQRLSTIVKETSTPVYALGIDTQSFPYFDLKNQL